MQSCKLDMNDTENWSMKLSKCLICMSINPMKYLRRINTSVCGRLTIDNKQDEKSKFEDLIVISNIDQIAFPYIFKFSRSSIF